MGPSNPGLPLRLAGKDNHRWLMVGWLDGICSMTETRPPLHADTMMVRCKRDERPPVANSLFEICSATMLRRARLSQRGFVNPASCLAVVTDNERAVIPALVPRNHFERNMPFGIKMQP